jgi:hypothetical protein
MAIWPEASSVHNSIVGRSMFVVRALRPRTQRQAGEGEQPAAGFLQA